MPVGYAIFAMALGICAGALLRRTLPALAVTLAGFAGIRVLIALWLRLHYMTPVTVYYKLTGSYQPSGFLPESQPGHRRPERPAPGRLRAATSSTAHRSRPYAPRPCRTPIAPCMAAHGYRGYLTYQPASRFWAFQGIETGIFLVLAAALLGVTFWVLKRRDA